MKNPMSTLMFTLPPLPSPLSHLPSIIQSDYLYISSPQRRLLPPVILALALVGRGQRFCFGGGKGAQRQFKGPYGKDSEVRIALREATSTRP